MLFVYLSSLLGKGDCRGWEFIATQIENTEYRTQNTEYRIQPRQASSAKNAKQRINGSPVLFSPEGKRVEFLTEQIGDKSKVDSRE